MNAFEVGGLPEALGVGGPKNPIGDVGVEGREVPVEGERRSAEGELHSAVVGEAALGSQVRVAARTEIEVVHGWVAVIAGGRGFKDQSLQQLVLGKDGRYRRHEVAAVGLLSEHGGQ